MIDDTAKHPSGIIDMTFLLTHPDGSRQWWVDASGAFTTSRPGLQRIDTVWKLLGKLHVLASMADGQDRHDHGVLVLTSNLPKPGSPGDRGLRSVGPHVIFDAIEMYDPAGLARLQHDATSTDPRPLPGFWTERELAETPLLMDDRTIGAYAVRRSDPEHLLLADSEDTLSKVIALRWIGEWVPGPSQSTAADEVRGRGPRRTLERRRRGMDDGHRGDPRHLPVRVEVHVAADYSEAEFGPRVQTTPLLLD